MKRKFLIISIGVCFLLTNFCYCFADIDEDTMVWSPIRNADTSSNISEDKAISTGTNSEASNNSTSASDNTDSPNNTIATNSTSANSADISNTNSTNTATNEIFNTNSTLVNSTGLITNSTTVENNPLQLTCAGAILIEQNSGNVLYNHNMHEKLRPASVTKVMSLLLIMEALDSGRISLTDKVPCTEDAAKMGGSQIWLDTREELTVDEMLKAISVVSANDCVVAMANYLEGSQEAFVMKMNEKAKALGMNDTTFKNCHGIDEDGHLTSPYDIAIMSRELLVKHPSITNYTTIYMDSLRDGKSQLVNTNKLIKNFEGCTGLKTGSTSIALYNLSASATRNSLSLIAVVMKAETGPIRFSEASKLLNYGFSNYQYKELAKQNEVASQCSVSKGLSPTVDVVFEQNYGLILPKSNSTNIDQQIKIDSNIHAPITKGQKLGEVTFLSDGNVLGSVNLVASADVEKYSFSAMLCNVYANWFSMLRK